MLDIEQARFNMIEQQIRPCEVLDSRILELLKHVRRELYVPKGLRDMAFMDLEIPLGYGASMWQPKLEARTLQELHIGRNEKVLEVGTGSGYMTALLSVLAGHVTSVEIVPELSAMAKQNLQANHRDNITLEIGDAALGWGGGEKLRCDRADRLDPGAAGLVPEQPEYRRPPVCDRRRCAGDGSQADYPRRTGYF